MTVSIAWNVQKLVAFSRVGWYEGNVREKKRTDSLFQREDHQGTEDEEVVGESVTEVTDL